MGGVRKLAVLSIALACAAALAACGSDSSSDTTATTTAQEPAAGPSEGGGNGGNGQGKEAQPGGSTGGKSGGKGGEASGGGSGSTSDERSAQFRTPGGDNSIQNFGGEATGGERAEATKTITVFFGASKSQEWAKVCSVLSVKAVEQLNAFAKQSPKLKGKSCPGVIKLVFSSAPLSARPEEIKGGVISLRRKGDQSFALYHGSDGKSYAFPLLREDGEWKLIGMGATPLSP